MAQRQIKIRKETYRDLQELKKALNKDSFNAVIRHMVAFFYRHIK